jgi:hypothetical protein
MRGIVVIRERERVVAIQPAVDCMSPLGTFPDRDHRRSPVCPPGPGHRVSLRGAWAMPRPLTDTPETRADIRDFPWDRHGRAGQSFVTRQPDRRA